MTIRITPTQFQYDITDEQRLWIKRRITGAGYDWAGVVNIEIGADQMLITPRIGLSAVAIIAIDPDKPYPNARGPYARR